MATRAPVQLPRWADQLLAFAHVDWRPPTRQPSAGRVVLAAVLALVGSLVADAVLVAIGEHVFPTTRNFVHFRVTDYGALTVIGVLIACVGWPIVTRITSTPRWLFFRLAIVVTLFLFLPDVWILVMGETAEAVAVLLVMHLAIALVTYNALVNVAPAGRRRSVGGGPSRSVAGVRPVRGDHVPDDVEGRAPERRGALLGTARPDRRDRPAPSTPDVRLISSSLAAPANAALRRPASSAGPRPAAGRRPAGGPRPAAAMTRAATAAAAAGVVDGGRVPSRGAGGRRPSSVARPPASLSEPRSAVRVLPRGSRTVEAAIAAVPGTVPEPKRPAETSGRPRARGRHAAGEPPVDR